jgi:hypothetical protein
MTKYSVCFVILLCLSFLTAQNNYSKGTESRTQIRNNTHLMSIFNEAVFKYGPGYCNSIPFKVVLLNLKKDLDIIKAK